MKSIDVKDPDIEHQISLHTQRLKSIENRLNINYQNIDDIDKIAENFEDQVIDKRIPHITNMNKDEQLAGKIFYSLSDIGLKTVPITIGSRQADPKPDIILKGVGI